MSPDLFILTVSLYLIALVASLIASFFYKSVSVRFVNFLVIFHVLALIVWIILPGKADSLAAPVTSNYFFLTYFCSGILVAGLVLRNSYHSIMKIYFGLLLSSVILFIISPSRMLGFIASGDVKAHNPERIHITENYFLVEQNETSVKPHPDSSYFKLVREMGMFHKTLERDIALPSDPDSVIINMKNVNLALLKVYNNSKVYQLNLNLPAKP